jgi:DNA recombination protein RmuC
MGESMNAVLTGAVLLVAVLVLWLVLRGSSDEKKSTALESQMSELRRDLQTIATAQAQSTGQMEAIARNVAQRLDGVSKILQDGVSSSAQISAQAQSAMANELKNSRDTLGQIQQQLGAVQQAGHQMSQTAQTLQSILGGAKSRGALGEIALERLLEDALPKERYRRQYRFSSGEAADVVIFLREKLLPIDSKFPLDAFRRITEQTALPFTPQIDEARRAFITAVKGHADAIAKKYIVPSEGTLGIALMFVPSENVYYELLMTADSKGLPLDEYCRSRSVIAVSPNTLYAHLQVILMGLQGMQIEDNAKLLHASLAGMQKQMETFAEVFEKLGTHLKNAQQSYSEGERRLDRAQSSLDGMLKAGTPEPTIEDAQRTLSLLPESAAKKSA